MMNLVITALLVSIDISFILFFTITTFFNLSVGSALVLKNKVKESPLRNLNEPGDDGAPG